MNKTERIILMVNGNKHYLDQVLAIAKTGPQIVVDINEIRIGANDSDPVKEQVWDETTVNTIQLCPERHAGELIVYLHEGKYMVLSGRNKVDAAIASADPKTLKARLVSKPALKKARVPEEVMPQREVKPEYSEEFANRPRFVDKRSTNSNERRVSRPWSPGISAGLQKRVDEDRRTVSSEAVMKHQYDKPYYRKG